MPVIVSLEEDVALVLFELLASEKLEATLDAAQRHALSLLEGALEKQLAAPLSPDYPQRLESARRSLLERYGS